MKDVLGFLLDKSKDASLVAGTRALFELESFEAVFDFVPNSKLKADEYESFPRLTPFNLETLSNCTISDCFLASAEYLGYREDINVNYEPISITSKLYDLLRVLEKINPNAVSSFRLFENYGYSDDIDSQLYCNGEPNFIFEIHLTEKSYNSIHFFATLLEGAKLSNSTPPKFYWPFYKRYGRFPDSKNLHIPITNTKARRLGYLKLMGELFQDNKKHSVNFFSTKLEKYVQQYEGDLLSHLNNKGKISVSKSGVSATPYIDLAKQLGLINQLTNSYSAGKLFKVYNILREQIGQQEENVFNLTRLDKLFFMEILIRKDFLYLYVILEAIYIKGEVDYNYLSNHLKSRLLQRISELMESFEFEKSSKAFKEIKKVADRISSWQEPKKYSEHIVMPRLNWLMDLDLINLDDNLVSSLTPKGQIFVHQLFYWDDINYGRVIDPLEFLNHFHISVFDTMFPQQIVEQGNHLSHELLGEKALAYIEESFDFFRTLAPNRVTASQAITYAKYKLYLMDGESVGFKYVVSLLEDKSQNSYVYKFQKQYDDGYIQKKTQ